MFRKRQNQEIHVVEKPMKIENSNVWKSQNTEFWCLEKLTQWIPKVGRPKSKIPILGKPKSRVPVFGKADIKNFSVCKSNP